MTNVTVTEDAVTVVATSDPVQVKAGGQAAVDAHNEDASAHPDLAALSGDVVVVKHAADSTVARPAGANVVHWYGTVAPNNAATDDVWVDNTNDAPRLLRFDGTAFDEIGSASSGALTVISRQKLGVAAANVDFTSIPADYDTLKLVVSARSDAAAAQVGIAVQFNGDTAGNYQWQRAHTDGGGEAYLAAANTADLDIGTIAGAQALANHAGMLSLEIPHYAEATFHQYAFSQSVASFGAATAELEAWDHWGRWGAAAAINRINVLCATGNFVAGSVFTLYGLEEA